MNMNLFNTVSKMKEYLSYIDKLNTNLDNEYSLQITKEIKKNLKKINNSINILSNISNGKSFKELYFEQMEKEGLYSIAIKNAKDYEWEDLYTNAISWKYWPNVYLATRNGDLIIDGKDYPFKQLPEEVDYLKNLKRIKIVNCQMEVWPSDLLKKNTKIIYLNLSGNKLKYIPNEFYRQNVDLVKLNISKNPISIFHEFTHFRALVYFDASFTSISWIPKMNKSLKIVNLISSLVQVKSSFDNIELLTDLPGNNKRVILVGSIPPKDDNKYLIFENRSAQYFNTYGLLQIFYKKIEITQHTNIMCSCIDGLNFAKVFERFLIELYSENKPYISELIKILEKESVEKTYNLVRDPRIQPPVFINSSTREQNISRIEPMDNIKSRQPEKRKHDEIDLDVEKIYKELEDTGKLQKIYDEPEKIIETYKQIHNEYYYERK